MNKKIALFLMLSTTLSLSGCGAFKPDHPQIYKSFKERRSPKENEMAANGDMGNSQSKQLSSFRPYNGVSGTPSPVQVNSNSSPKIQMAENNAANTAPSSGSSLAEMIAKLFSGSSSNNASANVNSAYQRTLPKGNEESIAYNNMRSNVQGSADSYSYYEMAEDIPAYQTAEFGNVNYVQNDQSPNVLPSKPQVDTPNDSNLSMGHDSKPNLSQQPKMQPEHPQPQTVQQEMQQKPQPLPSAPGVQTQAAPPAPMDRKPMVELPNEPTMEQMKNKAEQQVQPELKSVPRTPDEFNDSKQNKVEEQHVEVKKSETVDKPAEKKNESVKKDVVKKQGKKKSKTVKNTSKKKGNKKKEIVKAESGVPDSKAIRDLNSQLDNVNGKVIVTGYLDHGSEDQSESDTDAN